MTPNVKRTCHDSSPLHSDSPVDIVHWPENTQARTSRAFSAAAPFASQCFLAHVS